VRECLIGFDKAILIVLYILIVIQVVQEWSFDLTLLHL